MTARINPVSCRLTGTVTCWTNRGGSVNGFSAQGYLNTLSTEEFFALIRNSISTWKHLPERKSEQFKSSLDENILEVGKRNGVHPFIVWLKCTTLRL